MREPINLLKKFKSDSSDAIDLQKMYSYLLKAELFDDALRSTAVDYYSKGVDSVKNTLNNYPDLDKTRTPEKKDTRSDEQKKAEEYNRKQFAQNTGRGRIK
jgi:hypothetical protein